MVNYFPKTQKSTMSSKMTPAWPISQIEQLQDDHDKLKQT